MSPKKFSNRTQAVAKEGQSTYRRVRMRNLGKWVSEIRKPRKKRRIWLGTFPSAEKAARAHDVGSLIIRGHSVHFNFPELVHEFSRPVTLSAKDIRAAVIAFSYGRSYGEELSQALLLNSHCSVSTVTSHETREDSSKSRSTDDDMFFDLPELFLT